MDPIRVGSVVSYHGSFDEFHDDLFTVEAHGKPSAFVADHYPDGVAYTLRSEEGQWLYNARRESITPILG